MKDFRFPVFATIKEELEKLQILDLHFSNLNI